MINEQFNNQTAITRGVQFNNLKLRGRKLFLLHRLTRYGSMYAIDVLKDRYHKQMKIVRKREQNGMSNGAGSINHWREYISR